MRGISQKYKKDFKSLDYKNPRLEKKRQSQKRKVKNLIYWLIIVVFFILFYFIFYSSFFAIKNIEIDGLQNVKMSNVENIINNYRNSHKYLIFSKNNFWIFNKSELIKEINKAYTFEKLNINKNFPNKIILNIEEKQSQISWLTNNLCYHLDPTGLAIEYCPEESTDNLIKIIDRKNKEITIGNYVVEAEKLKYLYDLFTEFSLLGEGYGFKPQYIEKESNLLTMVTDQNFNLILNENLDIYEQVMRLKFLLDREEVNSKLNKIEYFNLRFGEKVYYK